MKRKDKHLRINEEILSAMDEYAKKSLRTKSAVYEMALKYFLQNNKNKLVEVGVSAELISEALNND